MPTPLPPSPTASAAHPRLSPWAALRRWLHQRRASVDLGAGATKAESAVCLNLALQGGGAHAAYTWGALDVLLGNERLTFEGLSGSSAGAVNAVLLADGWLKGGRSGAQAALAQFWGEIGQHMPWPLVQQQGASPRLAPAGRLLANWAAQFTPAQLNPFDLNPLRDLLDKQVDFAALRQHSPFKLFVGATEVQTGRLRLFREHELSVEVLLASACLPKLHHSVRIDGVRYWDGGYSANPALEPLVFECAASDIMLLLLNPLRYAHAPQSSAEIQTRIGELGFSTHLLRELQHLQAAQRWALASDGARLSQRLLGLRWHLIGGEALDSLAHSESKLLPHTPFLHALKAQGQEAAQAWLHAHGASLGQRSSLNLTTLWR